MIDTLPSVKSMKIDDIKTYLYDSGKFGSETNIKNTNLVCHRSIGIYLPGGTNSTSTGDIHIKNNWNKINMKLIYKPKESKDSSEKDYSITSEMKGQIYTRSKEVKLTKNDLNVDNMKNKSGFKLKLSNKDHSSRIIIGENNDMTNSDTNLKSFTFKGSDIEPFSIK